MSHQSARYEFRNKPAGVRTLSLVSIGACIFTMVSAIVAGDRADPGRIAAQIVSGIGFLGVKVIEYRHKIEEGLLWGPSFAPRLHAEANSPTSLGPTSGGAGLAGLVSTGPAAAAFDPARGKQLYLSSCASCHGPGGDGMDRLGLPLRTSELVKGSTQASLIAFIKTGRQPGDPASKLNALMPPNGGNPFLTDDAFVAERLDGWLA